MLIKSCWLTQLPMILADVLFNFSSVALPTAESEVRRPSPVMVGLSFPPSICSRGHLLWLEALSFGACALRWLCLSGVLVLASLFKMCLTLFYEGFFI